VGLSAFEERDVLSIGKQITPSNYVAYFTITRDDYRALRLDQLLATSTDTVDQTVTLWFNPVITDRVLLGTFNLPAGSGTTHLLPPIDVLPLILPTLDGLKLAPSDQLQVIIPGTITTATELDFLSIGGYL